MPSHLQIVYANHLEALVNGLAELVKTGPEHQTGNPLVPETIVVQSKGMQRWKSMAIARKNGICANFNFPNENSRLLPSRLINQSWKFLWFLKKVYKIVLP